MVGDFFRAIIGHIGNPDAVLGSSWHIDDVDADPTAGDDLTAGQGFNMAALEVDIAG